MQHTFVSDNMFDIDPTCTVNSTCGVQVPDLGQAPDPERSQSSLQSQTRNSPKVSQYAVCEEGEAHHEHLVARRAMTL